MYPRLQIIFAVFLCILLLDAVKLRSQTVDMPGPAGSGSYGSGVFVLTNGNYVVTDQNYSEGGINNIGAVRLYNGSSHALISTLKGSTANDHIGFDVMVLNNGNYVVRSPDWHNGNIANAGAATWCNGNTGLNGIVSNSNSLVGSSANDRVGFFASALTNGNYVLSTVNWSNGAVANVGAATWCDGTTGLTGTINSNNSLIGTTAGDFVGSVTPLANGNYIVSSQDWHNGSIEYAGAATWCNGSTGLTGTVSASNSFVGIMSNAVASSIYALSNGNYLVLSGGAVTWGNGQSPLIGSINSGNSWIRTSQNDNIIGAVVLPNGNYLVRGVLNGEISVTWADGSTGTIVPRTNSNSFLSGLNVMPMANSAYVLSNPYWNGNKGAAILCRADGSTVGTFSNANALVGANANDFVGSGGVTPLLNNNFVVSSPNWNGKRGAATLCQADGSTTGIITSSNSLVGTDPNDSVGCGVGLNAARMGMGAIALKNGNYLVNSWRWNNKRGAVTWGNGQTGITGTINAGNSLIGDNAGDKVGIGGFFRRQDMFVDTTYYFNGVHPLGNGNYTVAATSWHGNNGAVIWGNGRTGTVGLINSQNALTGVSNTNSNTGNNVYLVTVLPTTTIQQLPYDGNSVGYNYYENIGSNSSSGGQLNVQLKNLSNNYIIHGVDAATGKASVTWGSGTGGTTGTPTSCNTVYGIPVDAFGYMSYAYDSIYNYLLVCRPAENMVTRLYPALAVTAAAGNDNNTLSITDRAQVVFPTTTGCGQIASLTPTGINPVNGTVTAKTWLETMQPTYYVARHYEITPATDPSTSTGTITLYFTQEDFDRFNNQLPAPSGKLPGSPSDAAGIANLLVQKEAGVSGIGTGLPGTYPGPVTTIDPDDNNIIWNTGLQRWEVSFDVSGFSGFFIIAKPSAALPLQLLVFSGARQGNSNLLQWKTANESGVDRFEVQRSDNGSNFSGIGNVAAAGPGNYRLMDVHANQGRTYYRLKMIDTDGRFTYSNIIIINADGNHPVSIYPNPVQEKITIDLAGNLTLVGTQASLKDASGRTLRQFTIRNNQQKLTMAGFVPGIYFLQLNDGTLLKILKQ